MLAGDAADVQSVHITFPKDFKVTRANYRMVVAVPSHVRRRVAADLDDEANRIAFADLARLDPPSKLWSCQRSCKAAEVEI